MKDEGREGGMDGMGWGGRDGVQCNGMDGMEKCMRLDGMDWLGLDWIGLDEIGLELDVIG